MSGQRGGRGQPNAVGLKHRSPKIPLEFIEDFLGSLGSRYFDTFGAEEVEAHLRTLAGLSDERQCALLVEEPPGGSRSFNATIVGFNYTGIFAAITGLLAASGFDISSGAIFTSETKIASGSSASRKRRFIVDLFGGTLAPGREVSEWRAELEAKLGQIFRLYAKEDEASLVEAKQLIYEGVVQALADYPEPVSLLYPVEMTVDESATEYTRLKVVSQDTPFFLFTLSNALALHGVSIEQVSIHTLKERVEDEIDFVDAHGNPVTDRGMLNQIKLSVLVTKQFTYFLGKAPDPYAALMRFEQIAQEILATPSEESWHRMLSSPRILEELARVLGTSDFLWEDFIRGQYESILPMLSPTLRKESLSHPEEELESLLERDLASAMTLEGKRRALNAFKDNEIYLIDLDYLVTPGASFLALSHKLTSLAEVVVRAAVTIMWDEMAAVHGVPRTVAGLGAEYAILGLGKFGGQALGYASDIELLFVYSDAGATDGEKSIPNREFFEYLFRDAVNLIEAKREGIFHIDLRLRPYGKKSPIATSLDTFCRYYGPGGEAHSLEKLALVRMRAVGGDRSFGARVERLRDEMIYSSDSISLPELREAREAQLKDKSLPGRLNAKFSPGALVDLEYSVQIIQCMYGKDNPRLRTPRIHVALDELVEAGRLSGDEATDIVEAYHFLRKLINGLRVLRGSAQDLFLPPTDSDEYTHLARRIGYSKQFGLSPAQLLHLEFETRTASVRSFVERHLGRDSLPGPVTGNIADLVLSDALPAELKKRILTEGGFKNLERAERNLAALAGREEKRRHLFARLAVLSWDILRACPDPDMALNNWERLIVGGGVDPSAHFNRLLSQPRRIDILIAIFAGSQFLADTVIREHALLDWVSSPGLIGTVRSRDAMLADLRARSEEASDKYAWRAAIRRFRRQEILRIGTRDICLGAPVSEIVTELSNLADAIVEVALERVWARVAPDLALGDSGFCVLAFGKLGGRELNYSSDLDLLGVFGRDAAERDGASFQALCSSALEAVRSDLSDYTAEGYVYRIDFRLRPYGRSGPLVQPVLALLEYYRRDASLWEFQALLKLRPVAGDLAAGEAFLETVHPLLVRAWDRRELRDSIARLRASAEQQSDAAHQSTGVDVKSGMGGIRDIEFLVQGLQLVEGERHAEIHAVGTSRSLELLAEAGILPAAEAAQLGSDYLYLRRIEHFLQLLEDRQVHTLPDDPEEIEALARRIDGEGSTAERFMEKLTAIRSRVRKRFSEFLDGLTSTS